MCVFKSEHKYNNNNMLKGMTYKVLCGAQTVACLQEVLLHPDRLLLLLQDPVFDDPDEFVRPCPSLGLQARVEAGDALQLLLRGPTHPHKLLLRVHAQRQLPVWTGNRKEAALLW